MNSKEINIKLRKCGFDQSMLAEVLGCSPSLVSKVINRKAVSKKVACAIAKAIDKSLFEVFPELEGKNTRLTDRVDACEKLRKKINPM